MDLADGGSGDGGFVEGGEERAPVFAQVGSEDLVALGRWHVVCAVLDALEDVVDRFWEHFRVLKTHHLSQFQGRSSHSGKLGHQSFHIAGTEH